MFALNWYMIDHLASHGRVPRPAPPPRGAPYEGRSVALAGVRRRPRRRSGHAARRARAAHPRIGTAGLDRRRQGERGAGGRHGIPAPALAARAARGLLRAGRLGRGRGRLRGVVNGVRVRRPWIDIDLWELFLGLRAEQKFPERDKGLVRRPSRTDPGRGARPDGQDALHRGPSSARRLRAAATVAGRLGVRLEGSTTACSKSCSDRNDWTARLRLGPQLATAHAFLAQW